MTDKAPTPKRLPSYRHHKGTGQAVVWLDGKDVYLGVWGTAASRAKYDRLIAEWLANGRRLPVSPHQALVVELLASFAAHAKGYYVPDSAAGSKEYKHFITAIRLVKDLYGSTPAADFSPLRLRAIRQKMIEAGWCRRYINKQTNRVRQMFKWGVGRQMVPGTILDELKAVEPLRRGRCEGVRESKPVRPVAQDLIDATLPFVSKPVAAVIQLQLLTGARPGELLAMRPGDVDRTVDPWLYIPERHKTQHHGHRREILIGPKAQQILTPYLLRPADRYCFSPAEAEAERLEARHEARRTPLSCGNVPGSRNRRHRERQPGNRYATSSYGRAIRYACNRAFPLPAELCVAEGQAATPEQLAAQAQ